MKRLVTTVLALALLAALPSVAAPVPDPSAPGLSGTQRLQALLDRVRIEQQKLKTLEARFVQHQESSMLAAPEESKGVFSYAAPDRVRWEYQQPSPITVVIQGDQMTTWYRDLRRADLVKVGRYSNQVLKYLGASGNMQTLLDYFTVKLSMPEKKGDPYRMALVPRYARISKRLKNMTLWIDSASFFPTRMEYVEADGDTTEYQFLDLKRNTPIPPDRFVLKLPKEVQTRVIDLGEKGQAKEPKSRP
ncbi:MAG TPA: outer membrane lipoprotein carrier protein LolA [Thermoanaerobaculia bacterium]|jgi:outer membrane lipoprotein-sorting protein|nr:outer membrane lipoprotein carrier protein LolA [Thermoanaerobaculia bacterium]